MPLSRGMHESRFGRAVRKDVPAVNQGASFELVPISGRQWRELRREHKGCTRCNGFGVVQTEGVLERCPTCQGEGSFLDTLATRLELLKTHVKGWDGVKLYDAGRPVSDLAFDESGLATIAETDSEFLAIVMACLAAAVEIEASEGKASGPLPSGDSPATPPAES